MENDDNDTDCGRFDIYSSEKTLNRSGNGMIFDLKYRYLTAHSIISVLKHHKMQSNTFKIPFIFAVRSKEVKMHGLQN